MMQHIAWTDMVFLHRVLKWRYRCSTCNHESIGIYWAQEHRQSHNAED